MRIILTASIRDQDLDMCRHHDEKENDLPGIADKRASVTTIFFKKKTTRTLKLNAHGI